MNQVILFDGICNLCNRAVNYIIRHDPGIRFRFATIQSEAGQKLLADYGGDSQKADTFWLLQQGQLYSRSTAALRVAHQLKGPVKYAVIFILIPAGIRDALYDYVAANRFNWFRKKESCVYPQKEISERFIDTL